MFSHLLLCGIIRNIIRKSSDDFNTKQAEIFKFSIDGASLRICRGETQSGDILKKEKHQNWQGKVVEEKWKAISKQFCKKIYSLVRQR